MTFENREEKDSMKSTFLMDGRNEVDEGTNSIKIVHSFHVTKEPRVIGAFIVIKGF